MIKLYQKEVSIMGRKKIHEEYIAEVTIKNPDVEVIGLYVDANTAILHKCKLCGRTWMARPADILQGKGCKVCKNKKSGEARRKTKEQYIKDLEAINPNLEIEDEYINTDTAVYHKCKKCGHRWKIKPNHTLSGHGCPMCGFKKSADSKRKSKEKYKQELFCINPDIDVVGEYINSITPLLHQCKKCGNEWYAKPAHTMRGHGCPNCSQSHGENQIAWWLKNNNIQYISQYKFNDCKDKLPLPFDFFLYQYNICIEYDGKQHFEPIDWFGGEDSLKIRQYHDAIKTKYCEDNNIILLRIAYNQNINEELEKFLLI